VIEYLRQGESGLVLVDTSVWIESVRRPKSAVADELRMLLEKDEAATTEVVVAEVLQGARTEKDFADWSDRMDAPHFFPSSLELWRKAAQMAFELRIKGLTTPLADLVIAAVALENDLSLYSVDDHFSRVPGLRQHSPRNVSVRRPPDPGRTNE